MKGKSIQSKSLNRVLGNIESINVQPYELFIKEEQKKLREYWLVCFTIFSPSRKKQNGKSLNSFLKDYLCLYRIHLANKALPAAYANWRDLHSQRQQMRESLEQELNEKLKMTTEVCD